VPLSEHEQRLLDQIERALYADDPKFASAVRGADLHTHYRRRIIRAAAGFVVGVALLPIGLAFHLYAISIAGFLVMLGCVLYAGASWKRMNGPEELGSVQGRIAGSQGRGSKARRPKSSFMERLQARWDRRMDERGH
jgi:hypothetical protein